ncbi:12159_t:CDS:2 [Rhizophagus irregularis]|nr:12159_t:CDS:2 [Rhizophagus irregularis]
MKSLAPSLNIGYLINGNYSEICETEWNLEIVERTNRSWFDELTNGQQLWHNVMATKDQLDGNYKLVIRKLVTNLREYLKQKYKFITIFHGKRITYHVFNLCTL